MRSPEHIVKEISEFEPEDGNWLRLDRLVNELWKTGDQAKFTENLFGVFERFPEDDGAGVFWSILHGSRVI